MYLLVYVYLIFPLTPCPNQNASHMRPGALSTCCLLSTYNIHKTNQSPSMYQAQHSTYTGNRDEDHMGPFIKELIREWKRHLL